MSYQASLGEAPEALNNSDLLERIDQLRKEATTAYDRRDHEAMEGWVQMVERYKAVAQSRGLI